MMVLFRGGGKDKNDDFINLYQIVCHNSQIINLNLPGRSLIECCWALGNTEMYDFMFKSLVICL